jgi:hypothetical protein
MGQQFRLAFDEIVTSQRRNTEVRLTHRWRELDSNFPYAGAMNLVFAPFVSRCVALDCSRSA